MDPVRALAERLAAARRILVFTGAGISTGSGIPDFRGPNGVWKTREPVYYDEFLESAEKRIEYWEQKAEAHDLFANAKPNATHHAIVRLEALGRVEAVVTQNIDGLHQEAGTSLGKLVEVHGTRSFTECVRCRRRGDPAPAVAFFRANHACPVCECGGWLKSATVSFGQPLDLGTVDRARRAAERADLVLALGSTLSVYPAAQIPLIAAARGTPYVIVNRGETDHDGRATLRLEGDVVDILPPAVVRIAPAA
ncbi:MAG TPA: Sir2 family NAD-dependent protein deacetylase [bacterium]|nr:Sir2 family NAD-dependent protein deacetylase [bacterium]